MGLNRRQRERKRLERDTYMDTTGIACSTSTMNTGGKRMMTSIDDAIGLDLVENVLSRLPAPSLASAACVSRSWNSLTCHVLSRPKLSSAFSLNPSLKAAVEDVVDKVLSEPIRPHFAIACISHSFNLQSAHKYITKKLGSTTPVVSYKSRGIMGNDALTNEFREILWKMDHDFQTEDVSCGISLTVGFVPGLKVNVVPLFQSPQDPLVPMIDRFVTDIRDHTASVSGCTSPAGIIMFGGLGIDMKPVLDTMDYAMKPETFIVGDECCRFLYRAVDYAGNSMDQKESCVGVALSFMKDRNKRHDIGDIQFHVAISAGLVPIGSTFKAAAVKERTKESSTWLSAINEGQPEHLDGQEMLNEIEEELGDRIEYPVLYIGVTKRRKCSVGLERPRWITSLAFHEVTGGDESYLFVHGGGIKTGDYFRFYYSDAKMALSSCRSVSENLEKVKQDLDASPCKKEAFGGIIFACCGRGEPFFGEINVDSSPFLERFPEVPLAGTFCGGEIGRGSSSLYCQGRVESSARSCLHCFSTIYLIMMYTPAEPEN